MLNETWKPVPGHAAYEVSDMGNVRSVPRTVSQRNRWGTISSRTDAGRTLKPYIAQGYRMIVLSDCRPVRRVKLAVLVAETFVGKRPAGQQVRHLNGISTDDRATNLAYGSAKQNQADRVLHGTNLTGEKHPMAKLTRANVNAIRAARANSGSSISALSRAYSVDRKTIRDIVSGKIWK